MRGPRGPWFSKPWRRWSGRRLRPTSCWGNPDGIKSRLLVTHDRRTDVVSRHPLEGAASWSTGGEGGPGGVERGTFVVARNPDPESKLPYLLSLPVSGGLLLKARDSWPRSARVYCHPLETGWPEGPEIIERVPTSVCRRRGPAVDLVLDRPRLGRSQCLHRGPGTARHLLAGTEDGPCRQPRCPGPPQASSCRHHHPGGHPGALSVPLRPAPVETGRAALSAGDHADRDRGGERKTLEDFVTCLSKRHAGLPDAASGGSASRRD